MMEEDFELDYEYSGEEDEENKGQIVRTPTSRKDSFPTPTSTKDSFPTPTSTKDSFVTPTSTKNSFPTPTSTKDSFVTPTSTKDSFVTASSSNNSFATPTSLMDFFAIPTSFNDSFATPTSFSFKDSFATPTCSNISFATPTCSNISFATPTSSKNFFATPTSSNNSFPTPTSSKDFEIHSASTFCDNSSKVGTDQSQGSADLSPESVNSFNLDATLSPSKNSKSPPGKRVRAALKYKSLSTRNCISSENRNEKFARSYHKSKYPANRSAHNHSYNASRAQHRNRVNHFGDKNVNPSFSSRFNHGRNMPTRPNFCAQPNGSRSLQTKPNDLRDNIRWKNDLTVLQSKLSDQRPIHVETNPFGDFNNRPYDERNVPRWPYDKRNRPSFPCDERNRPRFPYDGRNMHTGPYNKRNFHTGPYEERNFHTGPYEERNFHTGPYEERNFHTGPYEERNFHTGPYEERNYHTGPYEERNFHTGPYEARNMHTRPNEFREMNSRPPDSREMLTKPFDSKYFHTRPPHKSVNMNNKLSSSMGDLNRVQSEFMNAPPSYSNHQQTRPNGLMNMPRKTEQNDINKLPSNSRDVNGNEYLTRGFSSSTSLSNISSNNNQFDHINPYPNVTRCSSLLNVNDCFYESIPVSSGFGKEAQASSLNDLSDSSNNSSAVYKTPGLLNLPSFNVTQSELTTVSNDLSVSNTTAGCTVDKVLGLNSMNDVPTMNNNVPHIVPADHSDKNPALSDSVDKGSAMNVSSTNCLNTSTCSSTPSKSTPKRVSPRKIGLNKASTLTQKDDHSKESASPKLNSMKKESKSSKKDSKLSKRAPADFLSSILNERFDFPVTSIPTSIQSNIKSVRSSPNYVKSVQSLLKIPNCVLPREFKRGYQIYPNSDSVLSYASKCSIKDIVPSSYVDMSNIPLSTESMSEIHMFIEEDLVREFCSVLPFFIGNEEGDLHRLKVQNKKVTLIMDDSLIEEDAFPSSDYTYIIDGENDIFLVLATDASVISPSFVSTMHMQSSEPGISNSISMKFIKVNSDVIADKRLLAAKFTLRDDLSGIYDKYNSPKYQPTASLYPRIIIPKSSDEVVVVNDLEITQTPSNKTSCKQQKSSSNKGKQKLFVKSLKASKLKTKMLTPHKPVIYSNQKVNAKKSSPLKQSSKPSHEESPTKEIVSKNAGNDSQPSALELYTIPRNRTPFCKKMDALKTLHQPEIFSQKEGLTYRLWRGYDANRVRYQEDFINAAVKKLSSQTVERHMCIVCDLVVAGNIYKFKLHLNSKKHLNNTRTQLRTISDMFFQSRGFHLPQIDLVECSKNMELIREEVEEVEDPDDNLGSSDGGAHGGKRTKLLHHTFLHNLMIIKYIMEEYPSLKSESLIPNQSTEIKSDDLPEEMPAMHVALNSIAKYEEAIDNPDQPTLPINSQNDYTVQQITTETEQQMTAETEQQITAEGFNNYPQNITVILPSCYPIFSNEDAINSTNIINKYRKILPALPKPDESHNFISDQVNIADQSILATTAVSIPSTTTAVSNVEDTNQAPKPPENYLLIEPVLIESRFLSELQEKNKVSIDNILHGVNKKHDKHRNPVKSRITYPKKGKYQQSTNPFRCQNLGRKDFNSACKNRTLVIEPVTSSSMDEYGKWREKSLNSLTKKPPLLNLKTVRVQDVKKNALDTASQSSSPQSADFSVDSGISLRLSDRLGTRPKSPPLVMDYTFSREAPGPYQPHPLLPDSTNDFTNGKLTDKTPSCTPQKYTLPTNQMASNTCLVNDPMEAIQRGTSSLVPIQPTTYLNSDERSPNTSGLLDLDAYSRKRTLETSAKCSPTKRMRLGYVDLDQPQANYVGTFDNRKGIYTMVDVNNNSSGVCAQTFEDNSDNVANYSCMLDSVLNMMSYTDSQTPDLNTMLNENEKMTITVNAAVDEQNDGLHTPTKSGPVTYQNKGDHCSYHLLDGMFDDEIKETSIAPINTSSVDIPVPSTVEELIDYLDINNFSGGQTIGKCTSAQTVDAPVEKTAVGIEEKTAANSAVVTRENNTLACSIEVPNTSENISANKLDDCSDLSDVTRSLDFDDIDKQLSLSSADLSCSNINQDKMSDVINNCEDNMLEDFLNESINLSQSNATEDKLQLSASQDSEGFELSKNVSELLKDQEVLDMTEESELALLRFDEEELTKEVVELTDAEEKLLLDLNNSDVEDTTAIVEENILPKDKDKLDHIKVDGINEIVTKGTLDTKNINSEEKKSFEKPDDKKVSSPNQPTLQIIKPGSSVSDEVSAVTKKPNTVDKLPDDKEKESIHDSTESTSSSDSSSTSTTNSSSSSAVTSKESVSDHEIRKLDQREDIKLDEALPEFACTSSPKKKVSGSQSNGDTDNAVPVSFIDRFRALTMKEANVVGEAMKDANPPVVSESDFKLRQSKLSLLSRLSATKKTGLFNSSGSVFGSSELVMKHLNIFKPPLKENSVGVSSRLKNIQKSAENIREFKSETMSPETSKIIQSLSSLGTCVRPKSSVPVEDDDCMIIADAEDRNAVIVISDDEDEVENTQSSPKEPQMITKPNIAVDNEKGQGIPAKTEAQLFGSTIGFGGFKSFGSFKIPTEPLSFKKPENMNPNVLVRKNCTSRQQEYFPSSVGFLQTRSSSSVPSIEVRKITLNEKTPSTQPSTVDNASVSFNPKPPIDRTLSIPVNSSRQPVIQKTAPKVLNYFVRKEHQVTFFNRENEDNNSTNIENQIPVRILRKSTNSKITDNYPGEVSSTVTSPFTVVPMNHSHEDHLHHTHLSPLVNISPLRSPSHINVGLAGTHESHSYNEFQDLWNQNQRK